MKKQLLLEALVGLMVVGLMACGDTTQKSEPAATSDTKTATEQSATEAVTTATESLVATRDAYVATAEKLLSEVAGQLPSYKEKAAALPGPAKTAAESAITTLESAHTSASVALSSIKDATPESWQELKPEMDKNLEGLSSAYNKVKSLF